MNFDDKVKLLCGKHNASVVSGYRTVKRNAAVGGKPNSLHTLGLAADLVLDEHTMANIDSLMTDAKRLHLIAIDEGDHVHVQIER